MEGINGFTHPLQTPIILEKIFRNLEYQDLLECRRVCKEWCSSSSKLLCPLTEVAILTSVKRNRFVKEKGLPRVLDFMPKKGSTLPRKPFSNHFGLSGAGARNDEKLVHERFWTHFGQQIQSLILHQVNFESAKSFRTAIFQQCPNLQKLVLNQVSVQRDIPELPTEWVEPQFPPNRNLKELEWKILDSKFRLGAMEFISHFPSLENVDFINVFDEFHTVSLLRSLSFAQKRDKNLVNIKSLSIDLDHIEGDPDLMSFVTEDVTLLESLGIKYFKGDTETIEGGLRTIKAHAGSLKKLLIQSRVPHDTSIQTFLSTNNLIFENLHELQINSMNINSATFPFRTPNLKILLLFEVKNFLIRNIPEGLLYPNCVQLLLNNESAINAEDLRKLGKWFPNLEKLRVQYLDNETFPIVCEQWPNLTHLEVLNGKMKDSSISGFHPKDVARINLKQKRGSWKPIMARRVKFNLTSLKSLKTLCLHFETSRLPGYCAAVYGVCKLANLKHFLILQDNMTELEGMWEKVASMYSSRSKAFMPGLPRDFK